MSAEDTQELSLGHTLKDISTGVEGIAIAMLENFDGNIRFTIQPRVDADGKLPDAFEIDIQMLVYVDDGVWEHTKEVDEDEFEIGMKVEHCVTGYKGIILDRVTHMNGCVFYNILSKKAKKGLWAETQPLGKVISAKLLDYVDDGLFDRFADLEPTGGFTTRVPR